MNTGKTTTFGDILDRQFHMADGSGNIILENGEPVLVPDAVGNKSMDLVAAERTRIMDLVTEKGVQVPGENTLARLWRTAQTKWKKAA